MICARWFPLLALALLACVFNAKANETVWQCSVRNPDGSRTALPSTPALMPQEAEAQLRREHNVPPELVIGCRPSAQPATGLGCPAATGRFAQSRYAYVFSNVLGSCGTSLADSEEEYLAGVISHKNFEDCKLAYSANETALVMKQETKGLLKNYANGPYTQGVLFGAGLTCPEMELLHSKLNDYLASKERKRR